MNNNNNNNLQKTADPAFDLDAPVRKDDYVRDYQYYFYHAIQSNLRSRIELQVQVNTFCRVRHLLKSREKS